MLHCWCKAVALTIYLCWTDGIPMLDYRYTYAELSVYLCWTIGIPMLNLRYQDAILFWYRYSKVFTMAKIRNIRVVVIQSMSPHK